MPNFTPSHFTSPPPGRGAVKLLQNRAGAILALFLAVTLPFTAQSQCANTSAFGSASAPSAGGTATVSGVYAGEYSTISGIVASTSYSASSTVTTDFITIRSGSASGTVVAFGTQPVQFTSTTAGTYYVHVNTNSACGAQSSGRNISITRASAPSTGGCTNTAAFGSTTAPATAGGTATVSGVYAGEYSTFNSLAAGTPYSVSSTVTTDFLTVRSGSSSGAMVISGTQPVQFTASASGTYYVHVNTNSGCGTQTTGRNITMTNLTASSTTGCTNTATYGTQSAPTIPGTPATITCTYAGEYNTWNNLVAAKQYIATSTNTTDYLTIRQGTATGPVVGVGITPVSFTTTSSGTYFIHVNTNSACGAASVCRDISVTLPIPPIDVQALALAAPSSTTCLSASQTVSVTVKNTGTQTIDFSTNALTVNASVTGINPITFTPVVINSGTLASGASQNIVVSSSYDMSANGAYTFNASASVTNDGYAGNNTMASATRSSLSGATVVTNVACFGGSSGAINLTPSGGTGPYTYNWGSGVTTEDRTGLVAGTYTVVITDVNGCTGTVTASVTQPTSPVSGTTVVTNVACFGGNNGAINLTASGGTGSYTYNWGSGITTEDRTGLTAGTYTVVITDANSCTGTVTTSVTQPTSPVSGTTVVSNVACFGGSNGAINLTPSGGSGPYTYNWLPSGPTTEDRSGLVAGTYTVVITDNDGCTGTVTASVTQPTSPVSASTVVTNVACFGGSNGAINLTPSGGTGPYTYNWGSGVTTEDRTGLTAGTYTVIITDVNACTGTVTTSVTQPTSPVSGNTVVTNVACFGGSNGAINLTPSGGTGPYTYNWLPSGTTTEDRTGLVAGTYTVVITDNNGCTGTLTTSVTQPSSPVSGTTVVTNVACFGGSTGAINLTPSGGTGGYTYNWLPSGPTTQDRTGLVAGTYTVVITDANSCTGTVTTSVSQPTSPVSGTTVVTNVACFGGSNGAINLTSSGGTGPYTYNWLPSGPTTEDRTGLVAGTYTVVITDVNGCTGTVTTSVTQPTAPVSGTTVVTNVSCFGGSNGAINLTPSGGTGPYTYNWLPSGPTTEDRTGLVAGTYTVIITDNNGCTGTRTVSVTQPTAPVSGTTVVTNVACFGGSTGAINLTPSGGTGPYTYNWLPSGPTTEDRTGLVAGTYTVVITDNNACTGTVTVSVTQPTSPVSASTVVTNVACFGGSNGAINLTPSGGTGPYTYNWGGGITTEDRTGLVAGTYTVVITDNNSCTGTVTVSVTQPTSPVSASTVVTNVACFGGNTGAINLTPSGGTGPYTYNWLPSGPTTEDRIGLVAGTYTVIITDNNGCTGTRTVSVTQPTSPVSASTVVTNVACFGNSTGAINLTASGGTAPYTYNWGSGVTTEDRTGLVAGTYTVVITDNNACTGTVTASVTQPSAISASIAATNVTCNGGNNGAATVSASGGAGLLTYAWSNGETSATASGLAAGPYSVSVTDQNSCSVTASVTITEPAPSSVTISGAQTICAGSPVTLTASGADNYTWMPGNMTGASVSVSPSVTTTYTVTATSNSCPGTTTATTTVPVNPATTATAANNSPLFTGNTIALSASGGNSYSWIGPNGFSSALQNPQIPNATVANMGIYSVWAFSAQGCADLEITTVAVDTVLYLTIDQTQPSSATNFVSMEAVSGYLNNYGLLVQTILNVVPSTGPYTGKLLLSAIPGSSATNTLTINGNGNTLTGCFGPFNGNRDMVRLDGTDHITINGFVLDGSACGDLWGVHLLNGNENVTISNNTILHNPAYSIYGANHQGIIAANSYTATGAMAGVLNNLTITGNTINHGYAAIRINGSSSDWANNVVISNNTLTGAALNGIVTSYTNNLAITGNQLNLRNVHPAQDIHSIGIQISNAENGLAVTGNKVANAGKQALFLNYVNEQSSTRGLVANNMLGGGMRFSSPIAMQLNYANYLDVYFNSLNADFGTGLGLYVSNVKSRNLRVMNNSIAYTGASTTGRAMSASGGFVNFTQLNYNNYYSTGQFVWFNNALRNNLTQLRTSMENGTITHDQQSTAANPQYVSATDLHLSAASFLQGMGTAINGIATDFDGQTRPSVPSIGADEYTAPPRMAQVAQTEGEVYPNPFRTTLTVAMEQAEGAATIKLVDMMGRTVYQSTASFAEGKVSLNPEVAQGVYLLQITNKGVTSQLRVVKQ